MGRGVSSWVLAGALIGVALVVAYGGYNVWQVHQRVDALRPHVKLTSIHLSRILELDVNPSNATFEEYFRKSSESLAEIDKAVIQTKSVVSVPPRPEETQVLAYMDGAQSVIRSLTSGLRMVLKQSSANDSIERHRNDMSSSNEYTSRYAREAYIKALEEQIEAIRKRSDEAKALDPLLVDLQSRLPSLAKSYGADALVDPALLEQVKKKYAEISK